MPADLPMLVRVTASFDPVAMVALPATTMRVAVPVLPSIDTPSVPLSLTASDASDTVVGAVSCSVPPAIVTAAWLALASVPRNSEVPPSESVSAPPPRSSAPTRLALPASWTVSAPLPNVALPASAASPLASSRLLPLPKRIAPVTVPAEISIRSLPAPRRMSPVIDGLAPALAAVCRMVTPLALAERSMATALPSPGLAAVAAIVPLLSSVASVPDRSMIAAAAPSVAAVAAMRPLLVSRAIDPVLSMTSARAWVVAAEPPVASIVPLFCSAGTLACAPICSAVALPPLDLAAIVPLLRMPPAIMVFWPSPPIAMPVAATSL